MIGTISFKTRTDLTSRAPLASLGRLLTVATHYGQPIYLPDVPPHGRNTLQMSAAQIYNLVPGWEYDDGGVVTTYLNEEEALRRGPSHRLRCAAR